MKKIEKLTQLIPSMQREINTSIKYLNSGGCGIFTLYFARKCKEYNIPCKILVLDETIPLVTKKKNINLILKNINNKSKVNKHGLAANHFIIKLGNLLFDGYEQGSTMDFYDYGNIQGSYSIKEMEIAVQYGKWNKTYNRKQNKILNNIINKTFSKCF